MDGLICHNPKSLFTQNHNQILKLQLVYIDFLHIFSMLLMFHLEFPFFKHVNKNTINISSSNMIWIHKKKFLISPFKCS
jgi:hypothetical protein